MSRDYELRDHFQRRRTTFGRSWLGDGTVRVVPEDELVEPFPEPDPPDFEKLPPGTKELFQRRLAALPIRRIHSRIGADAIRSNESAALHRFEQKHGLVWNDFAPLGTWHMRAVHDRISAFRPDLLPPRRPSGGYSGVRASTPADRIRYWLVRWHVWNLLSGTSTWLRNRTIEIRAWSLRIPGRG